MMIQCSMQLKREVGMESMGRLFHFQLRHQSNGSYHQLYHRRVQSNDKRSMMIDSVLKFMTFRTGNESYPLFTFGNRVLWIWPELAGNRVKIIVTTIFASISVTVFTGVLAIFILKYHLSNLSVHGLKMTLKLEFCPWAQVSLAGGFFRQPLMMVESCCPRPNQST